MMETHYTSQNTTRCQFKPCNHYSCNNLQQIKPRRDQKYKPQMGYCFMPSFLGGEERKNVFGSPLIIKDKSKTKSTLILSLSCYTQPLQQAYNASFSLHMNDHHKGPQWACSLLAQSKNTKSNLVFNSPLLIPSYVVVYIL